MGVKKLDYQILMTNIGPSIHGVDFSCILVYNSTLKKNVMRGLNEKEFCFPNVGFNCFSF